MPKLRYTVVARLALGGACSIWTGLLQTVMVGSRITGWKSSLIRCERTSAGTTKKHEYDPNRSNSNGLFDGILRNVFLYVDRDSVDSVLGGLARWMIYGFGLSI